MCALRDAPEHAIAFLHSQLRLEQAANRERIAKRVAQLDSDQIATRKKAFAELEELGEAAEHGLRQALANAPTLEVRRRVEDLLE